MTNARPDALLPMTVRHLPASFMFQSDGLLRPVFQSYFDQGVIRVIAGAARCHVVIDVKRPYFRPSTETHSENRMLS